MDILQIIVVVIHVLLSIGLIGLILLHAGRGGGLSDVFGGGMGGTGSGGLTMAERNLNRMTATVGILFGITTAILTWMLG